MDPTWDRRMPDDNHDTFPWFTLPGPEANLLRALRTAGIEYSAGAMIAASKRLPPLVKNFDVTSSNAEEVPIIQTQTGNWIRFQIQENRSKLVWLSITLDGLPIIDADGNTWQERAVNLEKGSNFPWEMRLAILWKGLPLGLEGEHKLSVAVKDEDGNLAPSEDLNIDGRTDTEHIVRLPEEENGALAIFTSPYGYSIGYPKNGWKVDIPSTDYIYGTSLRRSISMMKVPFEPGKGFFIGFYDADRVDYPDLNIRGSGPITGPHANLTYGKLLHRMWTTDRDSLYMTTFLGDLCTINEEVIASNVKAARIYCPRNFITDETVEVFVYTYDSRILLVNAITFHLEGFKEIKSLLDDIFGSFHVITKN